MCRVYDDVRERKRERRGCSSVLCVCVYFLFGCLLCVCVCTSFLVVCCVCVCVFLNVLSLCDSFVVVVVVVVKVRTPRSIRSEKPHYSHPFLSYINH